MTIEHHATPGFDDQAPGTSGLRRPTRRFMEPHYLETFIQALFEVADPPRGATLVVGGDGRFFSDQAAATVIRMAAAHGFGRVLVGRDGLLSTPAASHLVRIHQAFGAVILSASHNPGGPDGDFGVKFNGASGGPAPASLTDAVRDRASALRRYSLSDQLAPSLDRPGAFDLHGMTVEVVDPVTAYADLMETLVDFDQIRTLIARPDFSMLFDAMHAVTGPYAREIFEVRLGAGGVVMNGAPSPDFGGGHPDPHPDHAPELAAALFGDQPPSFGAASDGDGDRNMILGPGMIVSPGDSLAILTANASRLGAYRRRPLKGVARSAPTSRAVDRVAERLGLPLYETPTGWKYFTNLLDDGRITFCGEESFGTGADHVREKDGLWAVLMWLNLLAVEDRPLPDIVRDHWRLYGRDYFQRLDFEDLDADLASGFMRDLRADLDQMAGRTVGAFTVRQAEEFRYVDPVDGAVAEQQGVRLWLTPDARITYRLSGTGARGATLRVYVERYEAPTGVIDAPVGEALSALSAAAAEAAHIAGRLQRTAPSTIT
ncbi:MAG: phosphoglucomutase [Brevundimonas sp.]|jgi:phosphoglucomutase|uniref:alpha-D-glucose phosphate-specific phosphoglucomutase n=1 Tax=Brevundimonas sp. TaxID=1871086 RepID=UPI0039E245FA